MVILFLTYFSLQIKTNNCKVCSTLVCLGSRYCEYRLQNTHRRKIRVFTHISVWKLFWERAKAVHGGWVHLCWYSPRTCCSWNWAPFSWGILWGMHVQVKLVQFFIIPIGTCCFLVCCWGVTLKIIVFI